MSKVFQMKTDWLLNQDEDGLQNGYRMFLEQVHLLFPFLQ
jgi:hypothetical protein